ncbi:MAG: ketoacyl-ACP synthase III [Gammaproteobacteria bacterium]|nr:ketoacyl-ACP synthase III [Gammaproteobacteria bacterium]MDH5239769.1 ketoacyl-ACP synthase III [Gammaproteobacteria bacterium]MDH5260555.1 ketoacyl-ACP synthase III [Gammaproteobacteria bacterium]MDH5582304.1 ketoacyl-ACP synthase III [Gammaproteobacteria bacterium]
MTYARIAGIGSFLPEKVVTNKDLEKMMDTSDEWIRERTGIKRRHVVSDSETTASIGLAAAERAMADAKVGPADIDLIIVGTATPDKVFPATACMIQRRLGVKGCPAFDVQAACSGFIYALDIANRFIKTGGATTALVIGAETLSRITNWEDRGTAVLFGDGAGCVVLQASDEAGIISTHIHADGEYEDLLHVPCGISIGYDQTRSGRAFIEMNGNAVFKRAVETFDKIARETMADLEGEIGDIDWFVPHQANMRIITAAARKLGMPMERVIATVDEHANTSGASIPLALDQAVRDGRIKRGDTLMFAAFGAGFTWGSAVVKY